jgi:hypothetical protein
MGLGIIALLCVGGVGILVSLYDDATQVKRSAPDAVVDNFLAAYLQGRDDAEAALYTCRSADLAAIAALRAELVKREADFHVTVTVSWRSLIVTGSDPAQRSVGADLVIRGTANGQALSSRTESWTFAVVDVDGWRVCGAAKVP